VSATRGRAARRARYANPPPEFDYRDADAVSAKELGWTHLHRVCSEVLTHGVELLFTMEVWKVVLVEHVWNDDASAWEVPPQYRVNSSGDVVGVRGIPKRHQCATFGYSPVNLLGSDCGEQGLAHFDDIGAGLMHPNALPRGAFIGTEDQLRPGGSRCFQSAVDPGGGRTVATTHSGVRARNTIAGGRGRHKKGVGGVYDPGGAAQRRRRRTGFTPDVQAAAMQIRACFAGKLVSARACVIPPLRVCVGAFADAVRRCTACVAFAGHSATASQAVSMKLQATLATRYTLEPYLGSRSARSLRYLRRANRAAAVVRTVRTIAPSRTGVVVFGSGCRWVPVLRVPVGREAVSSVAAGVQGVCWARLCLRACRNLRDGSRFSSGKAPIMRIVRTCGRLRKTVVFNEAWTT
jgi:hypothetical protein